MTAKNTRHENLRQLVQGLDLWRISSEPEMVKLLKKYATELRAALLTFDRSAGWLPICDAPKDGITEMLLWDEPDIFIGMRPIDCPDDAAADRMGSACWPKHYMPLPAAPEAT